MIEISRTCPMCRRLKKIEVGNIYLGAILRYERGEGYIQDIPLPPAEREFIKTGYCMECQRKIFD
jgi:hypothetical protein